jgi:hypothetical protein
MVDSLSGCFSWSVFVKRDLIYCLNAERLIRKLLFDMGFRINRQFDQKKAVDGEERKNNLID